MTTTTTTEATAVRVERIPLELLIPTALNRRHVKRTDPYILELAASIKVVQLHAGTARPHPKEAGMFELLAGRCRWEACHVAELSTMECKVIECDDKQAVEIVCMENLQRKNLTPMEEANSVRDLLDAGYTAAEVADRSGKSVGWVYRRAALTNLSKGWQEAANVHQLPATVLELIGRLPIESQEAYRIRSDYSLQNGLFNHPKAVTRIKRELADDCRELRLAAWKLDDVTLVPAAGACAECPKRSGCALELFDDFAPAKAGGKAADRCLDPACWKRKSEAHGKRVLQDTMAKEKSVLAITEDWQKKGAGVLYAMSVNTVKAGTPGAAKAVRIDGDKAGQVVWVESGRGAAPAVKATVQKAAGPDSPAVMKAKRAQHEARRWAWIIEDIVKPQMDKIDMPAPAYYRTARGMLELAIVFGTQVRTEYPGQGEGFSGVKALAKKSEAESVTAMWDEIAPCIASSMKYYKVGSIDADEIEHISHVLELIGLDPKAAYTQACAKLPDPKAWARQDVAKLSAKKKPAAAKKPAKKAKA